MKYKDIITSIQNKDIQPIYFLMGDEPYYIDKLSEYFIKNILNEEEKKLNQVVLYGKDTNIENIISEAKQFPFGANKRVVIIKEAQFLNKIENLANYLENPQKDTVLVICYKGKTIDKRKKFGKNLSLHCTVFESRKVYENQISSWILKYLNEKKITIENEATVILSEYLGTNLTKISNELDKLILVNKNEKNITTKLIESHIGISKEYNIFELQNALGEKNVLKANRIINYFSSNQKNHHIVPILGSLFSFFEKIMIYHFIKEKNPKIVASVLKINPFFIKNYQTAARNYNKNQLFYIFKNLKIYDLKSKGVNNKNTNQDSLLKELIFKILHA